MLLLNINTWNQSQPPRCKKFHYWDRSHSFFCLGFLLTFCFLCSSFLSVCVVSHACTYVCTCKCKTLVFCLLRASMLMENSNMINNLCIKLWNRMRYINVTMARKSATDMTVIGRQGQSCTNKTKLHINLAIKFFKLNFSYTFLTKPRISLSWIPNERHHKMSQR